MLDDYDLKILNVLKDEADLPLSEIGQRVGIFSPSAISKRIKELKKAGYIKKTIAILDYEKLGYDFVTITFIKTNYGKNYAAKIGDKLKKLPNVVAIYFILGDIDFVLITVNKSRVDYLKTMEAITGIEEVERSDSRVVAYSIRNIDYSYINLRL
ncbi:MAG: Lrp/AsnC family transcriptional regulator [Candidatus Thermoplasmatota archaeon]|nr:Lrp/AsnC family transcriptional regulator [Candidatus Thermoplasmatota archaeon]MDA8143559.1 Lrp/AsnC family transcriptional regulator [Thermoplasmatales archaeon]